MEEQKNIMGKLSLICGSLSLTAFLFILIILFSQVDDTSVGLGLIVISLLIGIILGIAGIIFYNHQKKIYVNMVAKFGLIFSIIGTLLPILFWVIAGIIRGGEPIIVGPF